MIQYSPQSQIKHRQIIYAQSYANFQAQHLWNYNDFCLFSFHKTALTNSQFVLVIPHKDHSYCYSTSIQRGLLTYYNYLTRLENGMNLKALITF
jgi:hypothetical protein